MAEETGIQRACDQVGNQAALGRELGVSHQAVSAWVKQGFAPLDRVPQIAELTGIPPRELCDPALVGLLTQ